MIELVCRYEAVFLARSDLVAGKPEIKEALERLKDQISQTDMRAMNGRAELDRILPRISVLAVPVEARDRILLIQLFSS